VQAEDFDTGGEGVAWHDTTPANEGGAYRPTTSVDIATAADTGGGHTLGWVRAGEWLKYSVNVAVAARYDIEVRVAAATTGGTFHIEANGVDVTGPMVVPATGDWQSWTTIRKTGVQLSAGPQVWRVVMDRIGATSVGNFNYFRVTAPASTPFHGTPVALPGTVQAEDFDSGSEGVAYHDATAANEGGAYRPTSSVDIAPAEDTGGGYTLGWVVAGEWVKYSVNVRASGTHDIEARVASWGAGGTFHIEANGVNITGPIAIPNTGWWQTWTTIRKAGVQLHAGPQVWRIVMDTNGTSGAVGNFNYLRVIAAPGSTPYYGTPLALPGTIQSEDFDNGAEGVAYHDNSPGNSGGQYRPTSNVDIAAASDATGNYTLGWVGAGEWLKYTVSVAAAGQHDIEFRVASAGAGGTFHIEVNGTDVTGSIAVPNTGGWQTWTTIRKTGVQLTAGLQTWRLVMDTRGASGAVGNFNYIRVLRP
jgi:Tfp pilus assembly protein PilX